MKKIIFILCLIPLSAFSQEKATIYMRYGTISNGVILSMESNSLQFESIGVEGYSETYKVFYSTIYLLIGYDDKILVHNPELKEEYESHGNISPLDPQGGELSKLTKSVTDNLYSVFGVIIEGTIISDDSTFIYFLRVDSLNENIPRKIFKSNIYLLVNSEGDTVVFNPDKESEYNERRKNLIDKGIIKGIDIITQTNIDNKIIDNYSRLASDIKVVRAFNPDGEVGTAFIDLGAIQQLGDDPKTRNIFALVGVPLSEKATFFGGFQRTSTSFGNESFGVNAVTLKIRFYIGN